METEVSWFVGLLIEGDDDDGGGGGGDFST
jgi:hypothetical protein